MVSAVILVHNKEESIAHTVKMLLFCDEVLVIDNASSDETAKRAREGGAKVISLSSALDDFSSVRNRGLKEAREDWVLYIDADEEVSSTLRDEIITILKNPSHEAYYIKRQDVFWGKEVRYGEVWEARRKGIIRLVKKGAGLWQGRVHETFQTQQSVGMIQNPLMHNSHASIADFLEKVNFYSTLRAEELYEKKAPFYTIEIIVYPSLKFILSYFFLGGFLDGARGFVYSFMMAFHSFLTRAKLYLLYYKT